MLVENQKFVPGDIINLKLISGDEICGQVVSCNNMIYELRKPCIVVTSPDGIGLIQAMFGLDGERETLTYRTQHVITTCYTHTKMRDHYIMVTSDDHEVTQE